MKVDIRNEWWLAKRIYGSALCTLFCGNTDVEMRIARMRKAIIERGLQETMVGTSKTTFAKGFERLYGESLRETREPKEAVHA